MYEVNFFDCNARIGRANRPENSIVHTPEGLCEHMDYYRIEKSLVYHKEALNWPERGNRLLIEQIEGFDRLVGCAVLTPAASGEFGDIGEYFNFLVSSGIKAIRLCCNLHQYTLKPYVLDSVLNQAELHAMPVIIDPVDKDKLTYPHPTWDYFPDYDSLYGLAKAYPKVNFIQLLPGMTSQRQQYAILDACNNVLLELSGFAYKFIEHVCRIFSAERILFGSCMPYTDSGAMAASIMYADVSTEEKQLMASGNLERLIAAVK